MSDFYVGLAEIFEVTTDKIKPEFVLNNANAPWDSLAIVSTIALANDCFNVFLSGQELINCLTVSDIEKLISQSKGS